MVDEGSGSDSRSQALFERIQTPPPGELIREFPYADYEALFYDRISAMKLLGLIEMDKEEVSEYAAGAGSDR